MRAGTGGTALEVLRPAPARAMTLPLATWMALARATRRGADEDDQQDDLMPCD